MADTVEEIGAETLYEILRNIKAEKLVEVLHDMPVKAGDRKNW